MQATPGKALLGLKVIGLNGKRISFALATMRCLGKILSGVLLLGGYIMILFNKNKQGLHDVLCKTMVLINTRQSWWKFFIAITVTLVMFLVIGVLFAIAFPGYYSMQQRAKEAMVKKNMYALDSLVRQMSRDTMNGSYPIVLTPFNEIKNPINRKTTAVVISSNDTSNWNSYKPGQVIYMPITIIGNHARGYKIYGMGIRTRLGVVIDNSTGTRVDTLREYRP